MPCTMKGYTTPLKKPRLLKSACVKRPSEADISASRLNADRQGIGFYTAIRAQHPSTVWLPLAIVH